MSTASDLKDSFEECLSKFKRRLTSNEVQEFQFATLEDVQRTVLQVQNTQHITRTNLNMTRVRSFLEAMEQFGKVIEVFLNAHNFVAFIWGPMKFMLEVASTWADSFDTLLDAYEEIGEGIPLLLQYKSLFDQNVAMRSVLTLVYSDILEFHRRALRFFSGKAWRQIFRSVWKDFNTRFQGILSALGRHRRLLAEQASAIHFEHYEEDREAIRSHLEQYQQDRHELQQRVDAEADKRYTAVLQWFAQASSNKQDHEAYGSIRAMSKASGNWILGHSKVENWREADTPVSSKLWLKGIPGAGKTILSSVVIDSCLNDNDAVTAYYYCKENDPSRNDFSAVFRGILSQMLCQCRHLVPSCDDKRISSGEVVLSSITSVSQLLKLFCNSDALTKVFIVIDGLDECALPQRKMILSELVPLVAHCDEQQPGKLRLLIVSQDYNDIEKALFGASAPGVIALEASDVKNDIQCFVESECFRLQEKFELSDEQRFGVQEMTCIRSNGMFLYAVLVMENLYAQMSRAELFDEVSEPRFPTGLEQAYDRIIERVRRTLHPQEWTVVRKLLGWMVCAKRPLKWLEIQAAMSIDPNEGVMDIETRKLRRHVRELCGSLISVLPGDRVELVHSTAKIHIESSDIIRVAVVECGLAALCFCYLTFPCFDEVLTERQLSDHALNGSFGFQDYAVAKWTYHVKSIMEASDQVLAVDEETQAAVLELVYSLEDFINNHSTEIIQDSIPAASITACSDFKDSVLYDFLLNLRTHISLHEQKGAGARNEISLSALEGAFTRNRKYLEEHPFEAQQTKVITDLYGERTFKCEKLTCFYFHEGFKDAQTRNKHVRRHDRPYICEAPDCTIAEFGFTSNKDLEKHKRTVHPSLEDQLSLFPTPQKKTIKSHWRCGICDKNFSRNFHLKNHQLSHAGERPHVCTECGKAFTRANDLKRHEKIHARRG